jgi:hypothetical protein
LLILLPKFPIFPHLGRYFGELFALSKALDLPPPSPRPSPDYVVSLQQTNYSQLRWDLFRKRPVLSQSSTEFGLRFLKDSTFLFNSADLLILPKNWRQKYQSIFDVKPRKVGWPTAQYSYGLTMVELSTNWRQTELWLRSNWWLNRNSLLLNLQIWGFSSKITSNAVQTEILVKLNIFELFTRTFTQPVQSFETRFFMFWRIPIPSIVIESLQNAFDVVLCSFEQMQFMVSEFLLNIVENHFVLSVNKLSYCVGQSLIELAKNSTSASRIRKCLQVRLLWKLLGELIAEDVMSHRIWNRFSLPDSNTYRHTDTATHTRTVHRERKPHHKRKLIWVLLSHRPSRTFIHTQRKQSNQAKQPSKATKQNNRTK